MSDATRLDNVCTCKYPITETRDRVVICVTCGRNIWDGTFALAPVGACGDRLRESVHCDLVKGHGGQHQNTTLSPPTSHQWGKFDSSAAVGAETLPTMMEVRYEDQGTEPEVYLAHPAFNNAVLVLCAEGQSSDALMTSLRAAVGRPVSPETQARSELLEEMITRQLTVRELRAIIKHITLGPPTIEELKRLKGKWLAVYGTPEAEAAHKEFWLAVLAASRADEATREQEVVGISEETVISPQQSVLADVLHEYLPGDVADRILDVFALRLRESR